MAECEPIAHQFMDLTVPEYAYMFGFLQADGHLRQGVGQKGTLTVELNARVTELLRTFQKLTPYYSSITERTRSTNFAKTHIGDLEPVLPRSQDDAQQPRPAVRPQVKDGLPA